MPDARFHSPPKPIAIGDLADRIGASLEGPIEATKLIYGVAPLDTATRDEISFIESRKYLSQLSMTQAGAVIVAQKFRDQVPTECGVLLTDRPYDTYALAAQTYYPRRAVDTPGIGTGSHVDPTATLGEGCQVDAGAVVMAGAKIGARCRIRANAVIGTNVVMGDENDIGFGASLSHCIVENQVILHAGVRIGQDGFGFARGADGHLKVPQLGRVLIGDDVEIGANSTIDRGTGPDTVIGDGCKIDNLVQIGHNVRLGRGCIVVSQVGISGSTHIGDFVVIAGQAGIAGHLRIGDGVVLAARAGVARDIPNGETYGGAPARPIKEWRRQVAVLSRLSKARGQEKN